MVPVRGHPFMTSTRKSGFWPPLSTWVWPISHLWTSTCRRYEIHITIL